MFKYITCTSDTALTYINDWANTTQTQLAGQYLATEFLRQRKWNYIMCQMWPKFLVDWRYLANDVAI